MPRFPSQSPVALHSVFRTPHSALFLLAMLPAFPLAAGETPAPRVVLAVHGGTGMPREALKPELEQQYRAGLEEALKAGYEVLRRENGSSLDAVETAIRVLEDSPLFNAGRGAVFTREGRNELDASIMEGKNLQAGSVAAVTVIKNPISAARAVMEQTPHVMLIGRGAEVFATKAGLEIVDPAYFWTEPRWKQIQEVWKRAEAARPQQAPSRRELGTVGAVALDGAGTLAAGTSTGGMTGKQFGRVGDSPIIGAGTYADNQACAVSATGHGEYFIRLAVAHDIAARVKYQGSSVQQAADAVIHERLKQAGGEGGVIVLDREGRFAASYNSAGLYRGTITADGKISIQLYER